MKYDFCIKNGHVIDPLQNVDGQGDVWICNSRIVSAPVEPEEAQVNEVIDAAGCLVLPGLIDFHTHLAYRGSELGLHPDLYTLPNGVTAAVDAGSAGSSNFEALVHDVMNRSMITMRAFLNLSPTGIITEQHGENLDPACIDRKRMEYLFERYPDQILGIKVRIGRDFSGERNLQPLEAAVELGEQFQKPVCVHAIWPEAPYEEILKRLRPGDILCHCYQSKGGRTILDERGKVQECVRAARERGVIFDGASGRTLHDLDVIRPAVKQGFLPDVISTDAVSYSIYRNAIFSLVYPMAEYLAAGMPLPEIVRAVTAVPARLMGLEGRIGTLRPGAQADVAVLKMEEKELIFRDYLGHSMPGKALLVPQMTIKDGRMAYRQIGFTF